MTDVKCKELPVIAPRMVDGVGWCDRECRFCDEHPAFNELICLIEGHRTLSHVCPIWATRTAARLEAAEAQLAAWESQDAHEGMECYLTTKRLEAVEAWAVATLGGLIEMHDEFDRDGQIDFTDYEEWSAQQQTTYPGKDGH